MEVEAHGRDDHRHQQDEPDRRRPPRVAEALPDALEHARGLLAREREELARPHQRERGQDGQEARRVDGEARADAGGRDHDAADRGPDDARGVEEARVERDRVRKLVAADELEGERMPVRRVEDGGRSAEQSQDVDGPERRVCPMRTDAASTAETTIDTAWVSIITLRLSKRSASTPAGQREERERREADEGEQPDRDGRVRQLDDQPGERDVLHPRAAQRDDLADEVEPVVAMAAQAGERARVEAARPSLRLLQQPRERIERLRRSRRARPDRAVRAARPARRSVRLERTDRSTPSASSVSASTWLPAVFVVGHARDQSRLLEARDVAGHGGRRDPLQLGELAGARSPCACESGSGVRLAHRSRRAHEPRCGARCASLSRTGRRRWASSVVSGPSCRCRGR